MVLGDVGCRWQIELSDDEFERDVAMVEADLQRLKEVIEARGA